MVSAACSARVTDRACLTLFVAAIASALVPLPSAAQTGAGQSHLQRLMATPIGALPPSAMPMPASRDHNYWGARVQAGQTRGGSGPDQLAIVGGIDFQWQGGSVFGITGGYRSRDCEPADADCADHALFGARARFNVITGGPTIGALFGDYSATTTLGTEVGLGYAPGAVSGGSACTVDLGVPISLAMLQTVRLVSFISPGVAWDIGCSNVSTSRPSYLAGIGFGVQQLGGRALDLHVGAQRIFRTGAGYQFGVSVTYVRVP